MEQKCFSIEGEISAKTLSLKSFIGGGVSPHV